MRFTWRDGAATALVGVAAALEVAHLTGLDAPGLAGGRVLIGVILGLGVGAFVVGATELATLPMEYARWMSFLGTGAVLAALAGLISGAFGMAAALTVAVLAMWATTTIRHLVAKPPRVTDEALRELIENEKVGHQG
jgi:NAD/NADP transhydrogenase beta subunit